MHECNFLLVLCALEKELVRFYVFLLCSLGRKKNEKERALRSKRKKRKILALFAAAASMLVCIIIYHAQVMCVSLIHFLFRRRRRYQNTKRLNEWRKEAKALLQSNRDLSGPNPTQMDSTSSSTSSTNLNSAAHCCQSARDPRETSNSQFCHMDLYNLSR